MATLYELNQEYFHLLNVLDGTDDEEAIEKAIEELNDLDEAFEEKAENIGKVLQQLKSDAAELKQEEIRLAQRRKAVDNNADRLKQYLYESMKIRDVKKIKTPLFSFNIQANPLSLKITDESKIPQIYFAEQAPKLDRTALKNHMKETGEIIEGAELHQGEGLRIR